MKLVKIIFVSLVIFSFKANSQKIGKETYQLLKSFFTFKEVNVRAHKLDAQLLGFKNPSINMADVLRKTFFEKNPFLIDLNIDTIFYENDYRYMKLQVEKFNESQFLNKNRLRRYRIHYTDSASKYQISFPSYSIYRVCLPLFSANKETALLYVEHFCGDDCAGGQLYILRKGNSGKWKSLASILIWIS